MDFFLSEHLAHIWLAIGAALIIFEFFITPGIGIVFVGLGAFTTGALLESGVISSVTSQLLSFVGASVLWALLLWRPLKRILASKNPGKGQSHIIGTEAIVAKGGVSKKGGKAKWSGTEMSARLAADSEVETLSENEVAEVFALDGSTLILKTK